jgi:CheY-like chemotaxis protein
VCRHAAETAPRRRRTESEAQPLRDAAAVTLRPMQEMAILVAEDDPLSCVLLCEFLAAVGHDVAPAHDGAQALQLARARRFDILVADLHMPVLDGLQLIRALRSEPGQDELKVIAVTGDGGDRREDELLAAGADAFMTKPLDLERLTTAIERLVPATSSPHRRGL